MKRPDRKHLRQISKNGIAEKRFTPLIKDSPDRLDLRKFADPFIVVMDLRRGSLASLDRYLAKNKGIPDREVAVELRKLISGTRNRSKHKIVVIEHPDTPADVGGRPPGSNDTLTHKQKMIISRYHDALASEGKRYLAEEIVQKEFQLSRATIKRLLKKAKELDHKAAEAVQTSERQPEALQRREAALRRARCQNGEEDS